MDHISQVLQPVETEVQGKMVPIMVEVRHTVRWEALEEEVMQD